MANQELQQRLWLACETNDVKNVRMAIIAGADVEARDEQERNALNIASQYGYNEIYKTLLAARAMARLERYGLPLTPARKTKEAAQVKKSA